MKFRNLIFVLFIAFTIIFVFMLGTSYAYYLTTDGVPINLTTGKIDGVFVTFEKTQYINFNTGIPISDSEVDTLASSTVFRFTPNDEVLTGKDAVINIGLAGIFIDNSLRVSDFNYKLSCVDNSGLLYEFSGDGTNFTDDIISSRYLNLASFSTTDNNLIVGGTYECTFRVWLRESDEVQNELMNKKFRGLVRVNTLYKESVVGDE